MNAIPDVDLAILGGGLAGLTLALQVLRARPSTRVLVLEKVRHPVPEAAHKVGESSVEIGGHYFSHVLGLEQHVRERQLVKFGLRFFFKAGDNRDITRRVELGLGDWESFEPGAITWQLDRGRLENHLAERVVELGATLIGGATVQDVALRPGGLHEVRASRDGEPLALRARWVVDATSRRALLKKKLGLAREVGHKANAAWFRIAGRLDIDELSDDPDWRARVPSGRRWLSTNHLLGPGYWVWFIPLASGSTSVGIVAEAATHPLSTIRSFERCLDWLRAHEPQACALVERHRDRLQDFLVLQHFSHGCQTVFSADRWAITGEAGAFLDPFYSPGSDYIALSNSFITRLLTEDLDGRDVSALASRYNEVYLALFRQSLLLYEGQYPVLGAQEALLAKLVWDQAHYLAFMMAIYSKRWVLEPGLLAGLDPLLDRATRLQNRMQELFRKWAAAETAALEPRFYALDGFPVNEPLWDRLGEAGDAGELLTFLDLNLRHMEGIGVWMFRRAAAVLGLPAPEGPLNPYAISLDPERWESDGLARGPVVEPEPELAERLERFWAGPRPAPRLETSASAEPRA